MTLCPPAAAAHDGVSQFIRPPPTKSRLFDAHNSLHAPPRPSQSAGGGGRGGGGGVSGDDLYEEDERLVHTGPNPLHN
ncbi:hypothetical protein U1Q18_029668 [Sarracenia purpurea var. burkii]